MFWTLPKKYRILLISLFSLKNLNIHLIPHYRFIHSRKTKLSQASEKGTGAVGTTCYRLVFSPRTLLWLSVPSPLSLLSLSDSLHFLHSLAPLLPCPQARNDGIEGLQRGPTLRHSPTNSPWISRCPNKEQFF